MAMEKPQSRHKYLIKQEEAAQCESASEWVCVPRLTFMALMLEAYSNKELDKTALQQLIVKARHRSITFDAKEDAFHLTDREFYSGLLAYIPWTGAADDCVIPRRYKVTLHNIKTALTIGHSLWQPTQVKALAVEELSPGKRQMLVDEFQEITKSRT